MNQVIQQIAFRMSIPDVNIVELVTEFGDDKAVEILDKVEKTAGGRYNYTYTLRQIMRKEGIQKQNQSAEVERLQKYDEWRIETEAAHERGYVPTKKAIFEQLVEMKEKGEISEKDYLVATTSGLACVHDMLGIPEPKEPEVAVEASDVPF